MIMVTEKGLKKDPQLPEKIDKAVFPGLQGGPHEHTIAGIAVALKEAATSEFKKYQQQIVKNAKVLAKELKQFDFDLVTGGTDNHLILLDTHNKGINGSLLAEGLEAAGIVLNKNWVPGDEAPAFFPNGLRLGTPAVTSRGMKEKEMKRIAVWINRAVEAMRKFPFDYSLWSEVAYGKNKNLKKRQQLDEIFSELLKEDSEIKRIAREIKAFSQKFPVPGTNH